ncbi:Dihydrolipoamide succinyltransferase component (E2) of 2-oxoglutarate dehydrogenase complex [hydrothermal vent metagenome]|uniref:dihydrolipoyllysine-residue succinyltransferase n=1 Tax=hydrothermal vent metagenome TaxID=652676 RepID=A0A3B1B5Y4_9ZZZZ
MQIEVKVPNLPESVADATLINWHKKAGDPVRRDENLVDLETDKVVLEITAPDSGVLADIKRSDGETVVSDELIAVIDTDAQSTRPAPKAAAAPVSASAENRPVAEQSDEGQPLLSPAVRKLVQEHNLNPGHIKGSGRDNRITKADVIDYLEQDTPLPAARAEAVPSVTGNRTEQRVPMSRLRARVAERLKQAQNTAAILTTFNEVNMKAVMELREKYKQDFEKKYETRLGFMSFFCRAVVEALKQFPVMNASIDGEDIVYHGYFDLGIAVGSPRGLVVPILRDVDSMSFADIEIAIRDFGQRAKEGKLSLQELTGGTFSITNGGVFGSLLSTPILNPPQSAILGMHKIEDKPVVENGEIVIRPMMYLALSYDHRIVDGQDAVLFLVAIKAALEEPSRMLLEI